jgi:hypothetical protein
MPLIYTVVVLIALIVGDGYYFEGRHVTSIVARAKELDRVAEQQITRALHFNK